MTLRLKCKFIGRSSVSGRWVERLVQSDGLGSLVSHFGAVYLHEARLFICAGFKFSFIFRGYGLPRTVQRQPGSTVPCGFNSRVRDRVAGGIESSAAGWFCDEVSGLAVGPAHYVYTGAYSRCAVCGTGLAAVWTAIAPECGEFVTGQEQTMIRRLHVH